MRNILILLVFLANLVINIQPAAVHALTPEQRKLMQSGIYYFNEKACTPTGSGTVAVNTNQAEEYVFWTLVGKGLTLEQASGVLGNMWIESGVNPRRVQGTKTPEGDRDTPPAGKIGYGLVQWTPGTKILTDAQAAAKSPGDLEFQVFLLWEQLEGRSAIPEKAAGDHLKRQTTVRDSALSFLDKFERAGVRHADARISAAERVYQNFVGKTPPAGITVASSPSGSTNNCPTSGLSGEEAVIDGFVIYNQYDPRWKDKPYGSSTVGVSGCGPSSIAMVVSSFTTTKVTPDEVAAKYSRFYISGTGSSWALMTTAPRDYGLTSVDIGTDMVRAAAELRNGSVVIATGQGPKPFTSGGHILVIRGITAGGNFLVGDSGHTDTNTVEWTPAQLAGSIRNMWAVKK